MAASYTRDAESRSARVTDSGSAGGNVKFLDEQDESRRDSKRSTRGFTHEFARLVCIFGIGEFAARNREELRERHLPRASAIMLTLPASTAPLRGHEGIIQ
ncbi:hypothetical protein C450_01012 [Halococcus salifodinae DSM 8989]|uniref:Uncharacterized protein n=1 Tax=Halococcus salifodinae DSM 8989 TaxID=1227456 RepID=M0NDP4_9EURY|nr:hypothetical protein C450_01012 [Halococcus salifodinae DSM 8989]